MRIIYDDGYRKVILNGHYCKPTHTTETTRIVGKCASLLGTAKFKRVARKL